MPQFHFDPETYLELMAVEVPDYERLQVEVAGATAARVVRRFLDLGVGTGMMALVRGVIEQHVDPDSRARLKQIEAEERQQLVLFGQRLAEKDS